MGERLRDLSDDERRLTRDWLECVNQAIDSNISRDNPVALTCLLALRDDLEAQLASGKYLLYIELPPYR